MGTQSTYNLRWNNYFPNLTNVFTEHQKQEYLVDVSVGCEGRFVKAHKLVLSACSTYFQVKSTKVPNILTEMQKVFQEHTNAPHLMILLNDVKFETLELVLQFIYRGEVKVADGDMPQFLHLGKMLEVKGLCSVELQDKDVVQGNNEKPKATPKRTENATETSSSTNQATSDSKEVKKKRRMSSPSDEPKRKSVSPILSDPPVEKPETKKKKAAASPSTTSEDISHIPRPPNAFMIFANQWRKKLAVEYPNESNKEISVRLGSMWKALSTETKDGFYEEARQAEEEHKMKHPGYYYSPMEARKRKVMANISKLASDSDPIEIHSENGNSVRSTPERI